MAIYNGANKVSLSGIDKVYNGNDLVYTKQEKENPLCFRAWAGNFTVQSVITGTLLNPVSLYVKKNLSDEWTLWFSGDTGSSSSLTLNQGEKLYIKNTETTLSRSKNNYLQLKTVWDESGESCGIDLSGNCNSLINYNETVPAYSFINLFNENKHIQDISGLELPSTTVGGFAYSNMFYKCSNLVKSPTILPMTEANVSVCQEMFYGCTSLWTAPKLPATKVYGMAYFSMFENCSALETSPAITAEVYGSSCCGMFAYSNIKKIGNISLTPAEDASACCSFMFQGNKYLKVNENGEEGTAFFTCPETTATDVFENMFTSTGGTFTGTPKAGNTYKYY